MPRSSQPHLSLTSTEPLDLPRILRGPHGLQPGLRLEHVHRLREPPPIACQERPLGSWHLLAGVLLPFAAGYFLSYIFRSITAVMAAPLSVEFDLSPATLGLMTSVYFLGGLVLQLPAGIAIDRYGPGPVQAALMLVAALGAAIFASTNSWLGLLVGRALMGAGVAVALMTGLKAIVLWAPSERAPYANGILVMLGALGSVAATLPANALTDAIGWRRVFEVLALLCLAIAGVVALLTPPRPQTRQSASAAFPLATLYRNAQFWRLAPLSATLVGTSWSLQGLWAAPWMTQVQGLSSVAVVSHLFWMATALSLGALALGVAASRLRAAGRSSSGLLPVVSALSILAQLALVLRWPVPSLLPWLIIAMGGSATVLSFASLTELVPGPCSARANAAIDLLHTAAAVLVQVGVGLIVSLWSSVEGHSPQDAYQVAVGSMIVPQGVALAWYCLSSRYAEPRLLHAHVWHQQT